MQILLKTIYTVAIIFCLHITDNNFKCLAQASEIQLANEYYSNGEIEKAKDIYEKLIKKNDQIGLLYNNYIQILLQQKEYDQLEKFFKKTIKSNPDNILYRLDYFAFQHKVYGADKAEKEFNSISNDIKNNTSTVILAGDYLLRNGMAEKAQELYLNSRKSLKEKYLYAFQLADVYSRLNKSEALVDELLNYLKANPSVLETVQNIFQNNLTGEKQFEILEANLYERIQKDPEEGNYNEVLLWLHVQNKNFNKALLQAKAIDKRYKTPGRKVFEIGKIAFDNKDYRSAVKFFQYIVTDCKESFHYSIARRLLINSKEEMVKNTYPVNQEEIRSLVNDYELMIKEFGKNSNTYEVIRSLALIQAFYLDNRDTAIAMLSDIVQLARLDPRFSARAKIDLGDLYLLNGEPWEASLIYSQVEKAQKDDVLGYEAKLRNAKLAYYKGEFELAEAHLNILKNATTREIANDAMELSIFISDNTALDTSHAALQAYASVDLLLFQNKNDEALRRLNEILVKYPGHSLSDDIFFQKAKIHRKLGDYNSAIMSLDIINTKYHFDILGDDALYMMAEIYEQDLGNHEKAMELYQNFMMKYPASIFVVEARKRFRNLRGDGVN